MGSKKCFNAKKFFFLFFPEYLPLILGVPINVGVPNPNFRGNPPSTTFFYFMKIPDKFLLWYSLSLEKSDFKRISQSLHRPLKLQNHVDPNRH